MDIDMIPSITDSEDIVPSETKAEYIKTFENKLFATLKPYSVAYYSVEPPNDKKSDKKIGLAPEKSRWRIKHTVNERYPLRVEDYPLDQSESPLIIGLVRVASLDPSDTNGRKVNEIIRLEHQDGFEAFNKLDSKSECIHVSRVWECLKTAGMMWFNKWDDVEHEVWTFGEENKPDCFVENNQLTPLPVMDSVVCGLDDGMELYD